MENGVLPELIGVNEYNAAEGKFAASVRWLITRVYENDIPDKLKSAVVRDDQGHLHIDTAVLTALTNGSLYSQAAVKIFKDHSLVTQSHAGVLRALQQNEVEALERLQDGQIRPVTEQRLFSANPFHETAHVAMMDALMNQHTKSVVTIDRAVTAVSEYTSVDEREQPMDAVDSLLFWINKICLLVRDDVERTGTRLRTSDEGEEGLIPEMEDLYEDLCDGCCLCALAHFYRPEQMDLQNVCFNDPNSIADCQYNWLKMKEFCSSLALPYNPFHFEIEDVLYLHETLQTNVNAFLADLFEFFEPMRISTPQAILEVTSPRRFVPIQGIPDLRAANSAARPSHPPRVQYLPVGGQGPSRSMSMMSADSLMTNQGFVSPTKAPANNWGQNVTNFSRIQQPESGSNGNLSYARSDSLPVASIRMALEEKRREHEKKKQKHLAQSEADRTEKGKQAFFALMQRHENEVQDENNREKVLEQQVLELQKQVLEMQMNNEMERMSRALSQPSIYNDLTNQTTPRPFGTLPHGAHAQHTPQAAFSQSFNQQSPYLMNQQQFQSPNPMMRASISNGMLNYLPGQVQPQFDQYGMQQPQQQYDMYGQPQPTYAQPQIQPQMQNLMHQSAHASVGSPFNLHAKQQQMNQMGPLSAPPYQINHQQQQIDQFAQGLQQYADQMPDDGGATFRLHAQNTPQSRVDPQLELNRNLTNWGMTYKSTARPPRKTWENQTFIKREQDLVNDPDLVPYVQDDGPSTTITDVGHSLGNRRISSDSMQQKQMHQHQMSAPPPHLEPSSSIDSSRAHSQPQPSPPRDPSGLTQPGNAFVVSDEQAAADFDKIAEQRRQARKEALLAKTMQRREQIPQKVESMEMKMAEKRAQEDAKKEMVEQRKLEKELHRQRLLEDYKRRKMEKELGIGPSDGSQSARPASARGHSQPPFIRTKSQMSESVDQSQQVQRMVRGKSNVDGENRIFVASTAEPTLKLFAKAAPKSNRSLITNALQYSVFPGAVCDNERNKVLGEMGKTDSKHFLFLFRDQKCQYRGLYSWDQASNTVHKITGTGPKVCNTSMMKLMFKYDSGAKGFSQVPTRTLGTTIDGFSLQDQFWTKPKIPHSGNASHRDN
ncbi:unnamed protein product, partial [Mesorhabditis belari]|uniref:Patronin n=1 Tax=Mesorhabditis belari TaxID=2138241 RepID=A0AAF3FB93_9BILA